MKITIYELLGMVKDGKAPKNIKYDELIWEYTGYQYQRLDKENLGNIWNGYNFNILDNEVEILDDEEKKIPGKIKDKYCSQISKVELAQKYNEIIDYLDYLKSKGDE